MEEPLLPGYFVARRECSLSQLRERMAELPRNKAIKKNFVACLVGLCYRKYGNTRTAEILDQIKRVGFNYATIAGITIGIDDIIIPASKQATLESADHAVEEIEKQYRKGFITEDERYDRVIDIWHKAKDTISSALMDGFDSFNPIYMMSKSGRAATSRRLPSLPGCAASWPTLRAVSTTFPSRLTSGKALPCWSILFLLTERKGLADTALKRLTPVT